MMGENIAAGQTSSKSAMTSWMNSQGHKENILTSDYTNSILAGCSSVLDVLTSGMIPYSFIYV